MNDKIKYLLTNIFGNTVRVKILEILLENSFQDDIVWLNISRIAKIAKISTSSSKRIVDELIDQELVDLKTIQTHAQNKQKEIRLNFDNKAVKELIFFYRKLKGFL